MGYVVLYDQSRGCSRIWKLEYGSWRSMEGGFIYLREDVMECVGGLESEEIMPLSHPSSRGRSSMLCLCYVLSSRLRLQYVIEQSREVSH